MCSSAGGVQSLQPDMLILLQFCMELGLLLDRLLHKYAHVNARYHKTILKWNLHPGSLNK